MLEVAAEADEKLLEKYLEDLEITPDEIRQAVRAGTIDQIFVPVLCGSAFKNKGVQPLLDAVLLYLPSPADVAGTRLQARGRGCRDESRGQRHRAFRRPGLQDHDRLPRRQAHLFPGVLRQPRRATRFSTPPRGKKERFGRLLRMHANHREDIDPVFTGDIVAGVGLKNTTTGDTLSDESHPIQLESMTFPAPVIQVAIEPKTKTDEEKLAEALHRLSEEDPTFLVRTDEETGQTIIAGMGELHLEIKVDRLLREFKVWANVGKPQVAYRETIKGPVSQGRGQVHPSVGR